MRTLEDCVGFVVWTGEGLRFMRFAHGSCSCFITLLTPVSHDETLLLGIRPVGKRFKCNILKIQNYSFINSYNYMPRIYLDQSIYLL